MIDLYFTVDCPYCGKSVSGTCEDFVTDQSFDERNTGAEIEYSIECEEFECPFCQKPFVLSGSIWEYPEGVEDLNEVVAEPIDDYLEDEDDGEHEN